LKSFLQSFLRKNSYLILVGVGLLAAGYIINIYLVSDTSTKSLRNSIQSFLRERETDFLRQIKDSNLIEELRYQEYSKRELDRLVEKQYGFLLYEKDAGRSSSLKFWSDQRAVTPDSLLNKADGNYFVHLSNGQYEYINRTFPAGHGDSLKFVALIPIRWEYYISADNLKPEFVGFPSAEKRVRIAATVTEFPVTSSFGNILFYLERIESYNAAKYSWLLMTLVFAGVLLLLTVVHNMARSISEKFGVPAGIGFLVTVILVLRSIIYFFPSILRLRQYELFDPTIYGSSFVLSSLGDLLINALLFCWIVLFIRQESGGYSFPLFRNWWKRWLLTGFILSVLVITSFIFANIVQSLIADARISFNVSNFFSLTVYSFIGFNVLAALTLSYFFFTQMILRLIRIQIVDNGILVYIIIAFTGLLLLTFVHNTEIVELDIFVLLWLLIYTWLMLRNLFSGLSIRLNASEVLFWLFIFSMSIATVIIFENRKIELEQRKRFADRLAKQNDPTSEKLLSMSLIYFDNNFLYRNFNRFRDMNSNQSMKDSLINNNFISLNLIKYDTRIYTYDSSQRPLFNASTPYSFDTLNTIFEIQGKATDIQDMKYYEKSFDRFTFIYKKKVEDPRKKAVGYFFILFEPQNYKSGGLVPELTQQNKEFLPEYSLFYSYAIYSDNDLVTHLNNYPFPTVLAESQIPKKDFIQIKNDANGETYDELWHRVSDDKIIVVAKKDNSVLEGITLFAYIFSAFLFLGVLFWLSSILIQTRLHWKRIKSYFQLNIRSQIHTTIIFVSLFSFMVIGVATILSLINRYNRNNQDRLSHSMEIMANEVENKLPNLSAFTDSVKLFTLISKDDLEKLINNVAGIHGTAVNLYDLSGQLIVSSDRFVYTKGILSEKMHPLAFFNLHLLHEVEYFNKEEQMGRITYQSIYCPLRASNGEACAYLNIPSFNTQDELNTEISRFLVNIIYLNVFIFLIAGSIALFLTNRITSSFLLISEKMRRINLDKTNEVIEWKSDDEIGGLVKEYNKMVNKLEESAAALVKSEREGAWREMARQVAHEIKNPLTPMKLSIQYLQKAIDNNSTNIKELTANVAKTLVEQIDHLSKIASDFSQFANIGNPKNAVFDLHDMLYSLTSLYETTENLLFKWVPVYQRIMVYADKTQLNRLFTNLLQNALEASDSEDKRVISVSEELKGESIIVKVTDNGDGIPEQMWSKIFMPNFTTKSSGTGLGLAMSRTIVEQAKGRIWFETKEGKGTTFFVELPILRATD
jgi:two-component system, NtrC family, nitrogen regulation sensor histidine kinase NtrY